MRLSTILAYVSLMLGVLSQAGFCDVYRKNTVPCSVLKVTMLSVIRCGDYYETRFTCDHYLYYNDEMLFVDGPEGGGCWRWYYIQSEYRSYFSLTLTKGAQGYPGADIFPTICSNAQSAYQRAKWVVNSNAVGVINVTTNGVVNADRIQAYSGDTITVSKNGQHGHYSLTVWQPSTMCDTSVTGNVCYLGFDKEVVSGAYGPQFFDASGVSNGVQNRVYLPSNAPPSILPVGAAVVGRSWDMRVRTGPAGGVLSGVKVRAKLRAQGTWGYTSILSEDDHDHGSSSPLALSWNATQRWGIEFSLGSSGSGHAAATQHKAFIRIGNEEYSSTVYSWNTRDHVAAVLPHESKQETFTQNGIAIGGAEGELKTYTIDDTATRVTIGVSFGAKTDGINGLETSFDYWETYVAGAETKGASDLIISEEDNQFEILPN